MVIAEYAVYLNCGGVQAALLGSFAQSGGRRAFVQIASATQKTPGPSSIGPSGPMLHQYIRLAAIGAMNKQKPGCSETTPVPFATFTRDPAVAARTQEPAP